MSNPVSDLAAINPLDALAVILGKSMFDEELPQIEAEDSSLRDLDRTALEAGFLLGVVRAMSMAREALAAQ